MKILVADELSEDAVEALRKHHDVVTEEVSPQQLLEKVGDFEALVVRSRTKVTADVIRRGPRLRVIGRAGVGLDNIDVAAATERRIPVVYAPAATTTSVAELTVGLMLALARSIPAADRSTKEGRWEKKRFEGVELKGKTLGLVGSGRIGTEVAHLARAFGMEAVAYDPYLRPEDAHVRGIRLVTSLEALLAAADFLSIHAALTPETLGLIGEAQLKGMKPTAFLINAARGEIVDEGALARALKEGTIRGAGLDVYQQEPPKGSQLLGLDNVVLTPHVAASTTEGQRRSGLVAVEQVLRVLRGEKPEFCVNPEVLSKGTS